MASHDVRPARRCRLSTARPGIRSPSGCSSPPRTASVAGAYQATVELPVAGLRPRRTCSATPATRASRSTRPAICGWSRTAAARSAPSTTTPSSRTASSTGSSRRDRATSPRAATLQALQVISNGTAADRVPRRPGRPGHHLAGRARRCTPTAIASDTRWVTVHDTGRTGSRPSTRTRWRSRRRRRRSSGPRTACSAPASEFSRVRLLRDRRHRRRQPGRLALGGFGAVFELSQAGPRRCTAICASSIRGDK